MLTILHNDCQNDEKLYTLSAYTLQNTLVSNTTNELLDIKSTSSNIKAICYLCTEKLVTTFLV